MSQRTLVEINQALGAEIGRHPAAFGLALAEALQSGDQQHWDRLRNYGVLRVGGNDVAASPARGSTQRSADGASAISP